MLGGDKQRGVGRTNFIGKANDGGGSRVFQLLPTIVATLNLRIYSYGALR